MPPSIPQNPINVNSDEFIVFLIFLSFCCILHIGVSFYNRHRCMCLNICNFSDDIRDQPLNSGDDEVTGHPLNSIEDIENNIKESNDIENVEDDDETPSYNEAISGKYY